jgi:hypothetical protein
MREKMMFNDYDLFVHREKEEYAIGRWIATVLVTVVVSAFVASIPYWIFQLFGMPTVANIVGVISFFVIMLLSVKQGVYVLEKKKVIVHEKNSGGDEMGLMQDRIVKQITDKLAMETIKEFDKIQAEFKRMEKYINDMELRIENLEKKR